MAQAGFQKYDPTNATPYQPAQTPEPQPAMPSPLPAQGPQVNGAVKTSGAIATVADGILRGFMQGRAYGQARKVMQLKAKTDNLQASYNQDAQRLYQMTQAGVDQSSPEYKRAYQAVQGSWGALMDEYGKHLSEDTTKKKSGSKLKRAGQDILSALHSQDPMEQSRAWYQVAQKAGPPVLSQIAMLNTPQAKAQRQAQTAGTEAAGTAAEGTLEEAKQALRYSQIAGKPEKDWTPDEKAFVEQYDSLHGKASDELLRQRAAIAQKVIDDPKYTPTAGEQIVLSGGKPQAASAQMRYGKNADGVEEEWRVDLEGNEIPGTRRPLSSSAGAPPKVGTFGDFITQAYGAHPTADQYEHGRKLWAQSAASTTVGEHVIMVPQPDGSTKAVVVQTTNTKEFPGAPAPQASSSHSAHSAPSTAWIGSAKLPPLYVVGGNASRVPGMKSPGNINIMHRPNVKNGSDWSSVWSTSVGTDKGEVLIPRVSDGSDGKPPHLMSVEEATNEYRRTGKNLGIFDTPQHADAYAQKLHEQQAKLGRMRPSRSGNAPVPPPAHAAPPAASASSPGPHGAGVVSIGPTVGGKETPELADAKKVAAGTQRNYDVAKEMVAHLDPASSNTLSLLYVQATNSVGKGSVRMSNAEINRSYKNAIGAIPERFRASVWQATKGTMPPEVAKSMLKVIAATNDAAKDELQELEHQNPQASETSDQLPDEARKQLKHGHITTFANGQQWTLDANGNPKRVSNGSE